MTLSITLPLPTGELEALTLNATGPWRKPTELIRSRKVYAAAHVTPKVLGNNIPGAPADIDWDATLAFRRELWSWGVGIADAMDTAQRGMGLDWSATQELINRSAAEAALIATPERTVRDRRRGSVGGKGHLDGITRLGQGRFRPGGLLERLRHVAGRGQGARGPALVGHHVRSSAGRVLGQR